MIPPGGYQDSSMNGTIDMHLRRGFLNHYYSMNHFKNERHTNIEDETYDY